MIKPNFSRSQIIKTILLDPLALASIFLPAVIFYLIIGGMPRNYPGLASLYFYAFILIVFTVYTRYDIAIRKLRMKQKSADLEKMVQDVNALLIKANPVAAKAAALAKKRDREYGEFQ